MLLIFQASIAVIMPVPVPLPKSTGAVLLSRTAAVMSVFINLLLVTLPASRNWPVFRNPPPLPQMMCGTFIPLWLGPSAMWKVSRTWRLFARPRALKASSPFANVCMRSTSISACACFGGRIVPGGTVDS